MNVSLRWIRDLAPSMGLSPVEVAERLADRGAPIESSKVLSEGLDDIVVARVIEAGRHPNADRLSLCRVDSGSGEVQVVCGAPNVQAGALYPFAPVGSTLPGGLTLTRRKIRGEYSEGMLCSSAELGLGTDHAGIMELTDDLEPGVPLVSVLGLDDVQLDVEVTANRGDLLSHVGVARELCEGGDADIRLPTIPGAATFALEYGVDPVEASAAGTRIRIEDPDLCPRYLGAVVRGVRVGPSPSWLQSRLRSVGARPVNNVVDATNYVLLELGQPMHAFDLDRIEDKTLVVRRARPGETLRTLDGEDRSLDPQMLMICDARRPIAIAGVMGGLESEVAQDTADILLECALFDPASIRSTRMALNMSTDASYRYERGVDPEGMRRALERAIEIIVSVAGGSVEPGAADACASPWTAPEVVLRPSRVEHLLGIPFSVGRIVDLLRPLGFDARSDGGDALLVTVPGHRAYDVRREVDLIEEIARTHGYENFPAELSPFRPSVVPDHPLFDLEHDLRQDLAAVGFFEIQTMAFSSQGEVEIPNPVSAEERFLRADLLGGALGRLEHNFARGARDLRLFEIGTVFRGTPAGEPPREHTRLAIVMTGGRHPAHWSGQGEEIDAWDIKAGFERVVWRSYPDAEVTAEPGQDFTSRLTGPAWVARSSSGILGAAGRIAPGGLDAPPWASPVFGAELTLPPEPGVEPIPMIRALPQYPSIERDLALIAPAGVSAGDIVRVIEQKGGRLLRSVAVFDVYQGEGIPAGARSIALRLRFQAPDRTLRDSDVEPAIQKVIKRLTEDLHVEHRA